jgi:hypothetical protein
MVILYLFDSFIETVKLIRLGSHLLLVLLDLFFLVDDDLLEAIVLNL